MWQAAVVKLFVGGLFWLKYRKLLRLQGYTFGAFRKQWLAFQAVVLKPERPLPRSLGNGYERREIRARW